MDPDRKDEIKNDLKDFAEGKSFYHKTGRAWKRGYLLYGPPGTGKSSTIAAMANFLGYDIYDLELTEVSTNSDLRKLLMKTTSKSIIVIEDIDCSLSLTNRVVKKGPALYHEQMMGEDLGASATKTITLSGLLNFTDGLWSCCGSERIFVFTTNHIEKLDPALLRSGRMDMHIFMSFCSFAALKILMRNYLGVEEEDGEVGVMRELEEVIGVVKITPADVSEMLIKSRRFEKGRALRELLELLRGRKRKVVRKERVKGEEVEEEEEEQEKRALESPKEGQEGMMEKCNGKVVEEKVEDD